MKKGKWGIIELKIVIKWGVNYGGY